MNKAKNTLFDFKKNVKQQMLAFSVAWLCNGPFVWAQSTIHDSENIYNDVKKNLLQCEKIHGDSIFCGVDTMSKCLTEVAPLICHDLVSAAQKEFQSANRWR